tara:strand:+ start:7371 stop:8276 length:906 start_codon:yes stop_codon:yes gene_type:complete
MADVTNATDTNVATGGLGKTVAAAIVQFNKSAVAAPLIQMNAASPGTNVVQFPVYSKLTPSSAVTEEAEGTEGTEIDATAITTTAVSVEVLRNHINAKVTDLASFANNDNLMVNTGQVLGNAVATKFDYDVCQLLDGAATEVGGAAVSCHLGLIFDAVANLEKNDAPRPYSAILHPLQVWGSFGLTNELSNVAVVQSNAGLSQSNGVGEDFRRAGFATTIGGVDIYTSPQVVSTSDQHKGGIFAKTFLGCGFIDFGGGNFIQLEQERNALGAQTNIVCNGYWEIAETVDLHGVEVHTETST